MRSAVLIHNPVAGRASARGLVDSILDRLHQGGYRVEAWPTTSPGSATRQARDAAAAGFDAVFALGGDGTLREAAAGLLGSRTALGFIPGGTINVNVLTFGLPADALRAAAALGEASVREIDVGLCNDEPFLMQASAGIDAEMIARLNPRLKRMASGGAVVPAAIAAWSRYRYPRIEIGADGETLEGSLAVVCNIPFYGGRWLMQPAARADDGKLDLVLFHGRGRFATLGFARDVLLGRHLRRRDVEYRQVDQVEIRGPARLPIQIDGDVFAEAPPARIRLAQGRLRVLAL